MHRNYNIHELSKLLGVHKNTLRGWMKLGLRPIDLQKPYLFIGLAIRGFLDDRRQKSRQSCRRDEMFCLVCKSPKIPAGKMVDYLPLSPRSGNLRGLCAECGNLMHRCTPLAKLGDFQSIFQVAFPQGHSRIEETCDPCLNCDSEQGTLHHVKPQRSE